MATQKRFYLTTPIYYVNDKPHIGHIYTTVVADVIARFHRLKGEEVFFATGTDENSQKNVQAAEKQGEKDIQAYVDRMSTRWRQTFHTLGFTNTDFIRTTEERHKKGVEKFFKAVLEKGDIYTGTYEGWYCTGCEAFVTDSDLTEGKCPIHKTIPEKIKEKNYFFKLTKYRELLLAHIEQHPEFIQPNARRNEIIRYIQDFMTDVSISRQSLKWGIPLPTDPSQVLYVWFDALLNYLTIIGYGTDEARFAKYWPADLHLVGKDIIKFHCALWPAMLMSAGVALPKRVFAHGYFTINGEKMSKSLGNVIDPEELANRYGIDAIRYHLLREIKFGEDGDFSVTRLQERYENDLANELGNLLHRVLAMTEKYCVGKIPSGTPTSFEQEWRSYEDNMEALNFFSILDGIWEIIRKANQSINEEKPWVLAKEQSNRLSGVLYQLLEKVYLVSWMLLPLMPETAKKIWTQLGLNPVTEEQKLITRLPQLPSEGTTVAKGEPLFPKLI